MEKHFSIPGAWTPVICAKTRDSTFKTATNRTLPLASAKQRSSCSSCSREQGVLKMNQSMNQGNVTITTARTKLIPDKASLKHGQGDWRNGHGISMHCCWPVKITPLPRSMPHQTHLNSWKYTIINYNKKRIFYSPRPNEAGNQKNSKTKEALSWNTQINSPVKRARLL